MKIVSLGFIDGIYMDFPRVDRALIKEFSEGIIATTCCVGAEVPQTIMYKGVEAAEKIFLE
ncbi:MAG TPA: PHP domain-containing protein, partial [Chitinophagales bacterium]|nr:PHP domain-containing protein [Chitinophagales bacterium]